MRSVSGMNEKEGIFYRKLSRREALSTTAKVAVGAVVAGVIAGVGGYYAGSLTAAPKTIEKTITETRTVTAAERTMTTTVTAPATTVTVTVPATTTVTTPATAVLPARRTIKLPEKIDLRVAMIDEIRERKFRELLPDFYKKFKEKYPEVKEISVTIELYTFEDLYNKCLTLLSTGSKEYHVLQFHHPDLALFSQWLTDLTDWFMEDKDEIKLDDIHPLLHKTHMTYKGRYYGVPTHVNPMVFAYRTDIFEKEGFSVPETFDEWIKIAKAVTNKYAPGVYGATLMLKKDIQISCTFLNFLGGHGVYLYRREGDRYIPTINTPEALEALNDFLEAAKCCSPAATTYGFDENMMAFARGEAATTIMWSSILGVWRDPKQSNIVGKFDFAPRMPGTKKNGQLISKALLGGWTVSIPKAIDDPYKVAAWEFLKWLVSPELERELVPYYESCRISILSDPQVQKEWPNHRAFLDILNAGPIDFPGVEPGEKIIPDYEVLDHMTTKLSEVVTGLKTPKQALEELEREYIEIFRKYGMY
jgi:multiple sugar transport system substrate-binding protein